MKSDWINKGRNSLNSSFMERPNMKTIICAAFKRFGAYTANSAELAVRKVANRVVAGYKIRTVFFRTTIPRGNRGKRLFNLARHIGASGIVCPGMASDKTGLCAETTATNIIDNTKYCPAEINGTAIDASRPYGQKVILDLQPWHIWGFCELCRNRKIPVTKPSNDANGFCCNHLMWQLRMAHLNSPRGKADTPFIFLHVPCSPEAVLDPIEFAKAGKTTITINQIVSGLRLLLTYSSLP